MSGAIAPPMNGGAPPPSALAGLAMRGGAPGAPGGVPGAPPQGFPGTVPPAKSISLGKPRLVVPNEAPAKPKIDAEHLDKLKAWMDAKNIADDLDDAERGSLAARCKREYVIDDESRSDWKTKYKQWLDFAMQVVQQKTYPWPSASNVIYPLITVAAIQFNARAYPAIVQGRNVVRGSVIGSDAGVAVADPQTGQAQVDQQTGQPQWIKPPGEKQTRADKIGQHMSWQLVDEMEEWEEQTDRLLIVLPIVGTMFRKSYFDPIMDRNVSETVDALRVVINYKAKSFALAPRITEEIDLYPWEIEERIRKGLFLDHGDKGYGTNNDAGQDEQAAVTFCEQHRRYDLDDDGYDEPYIVTFARDSGKLARIVAAFDEEAIEATEDGRVAKITPVGYYTKFGFIPSPDGNVYDTGLGALLYPLNAAVNTSINQLFDAGHLANTGGGFIGSGMSMNTGSVKFAMGEFKVVNTPGSVLKDNIVPLPFPGPNAVLFALLQFLVESAKEVASIKDVLQGEIPGANTPGILGLAVIQQGLKVFSGIYKRIHRSLKHEFDKLFRLNRLYLPEEAGYRIGAEYFEISRSDYEDGAGVQPVSDPEVVTDMQKMGQANFLLQFKDDPWFDAREIRNRAMQAASIDQIDKLLKTTPPPNPEIISGMAQLDIQKRMVDLREEELKIRAANDEAKRDISRGKDKAQEIRDLAQSILYLAQARKADADADIGWYASHIDNLKVQVDLLNAQDESAEPVADSPAAAGGVGGAGPGAAGSLAGGVPGMAPPSGDAGGPGVSGGLA